THSSKRIGSFASLLNKEGVAVHLYDHHSDAEIEFPCERPTLARRGANSTLMFELLCRNEIPIDAQEATLLALGIFQDTHSLTSPSTTPEDFHAAGELLHRGADLHVVQKFVQPRLNPEQIDVMNELIRTLEVHLINGVETALAMATVDYFVEDLAYVVHQVMQIENLETLFALIQLDRRVYLIARSGTDEVNVADIAHAFGGGGHANASSASIQGMTLVQVREKLFQVWNERLQPLYLVRDIMHFPVVSVKEADSFRNTEKVLTRFNLNSLPVLRDDRPMGIVTRQIVEKAIHHKLGKEKIADYMVREFSVTTPESYFRSIIPMIIEEKQKIIPVVDRESGTLVGIVSRGDLLRVLSRTVLFPEKQRFVVLDRKTGMHKNMKSLMIERLPKEVMNLLLTIGQVADERGVAAYVVGGFVRDMLMNIGNLDLDIVIEGDGIDFAQSLGQTIQGRVRTHAKFGTSVIILENNSRIDVATARMEFYKHPGALPTVERSSIKSDLFRRDFTFNSLAIKLNGKDAFGLMDYFNGERDLKEKVIRVMHNLSFVEDPCRIFRAVRFERRLGFRLGKQTEAFLKNAVEKRRVDQLSGSRLLNELKLLFREERAFQCLQRLIDLDLLQFISPALVKEYKGMGTVKRLDSVLSWAKMMPFQRKPEVWFVYILGLFYFLDDEELERAGMRLHFPMKLLDRLLADRNNCRSAFEQIRAKEDLSAVEIYEMFSGFSPEAIVFLLALADSITVNQYATLYLTQYHVNSHVSLTGNDLIRMGMAPGPVFQSVFRVLRHARVSGQVKSRAEEVALVEEQFLKN
ncbi:MAG: hypothetical protein COV67_00805, partial [Nitrospinae bacterium CG11_big_fil_rev_8_21_14_0_20_56_8]